MRGHRGQLAIVIAIAAALLVPGIWSYSLVDPWETHYGEVARAMLQDHDYWHTQWNGTTNGAPNNIEGFRSKPVLTFWLMAAGMKATGVAADGGYSGELVESGRLMFALRIPFVACAIAGLALLWWMLARLVNRRVAWLAFGVVATTPMFCLIARQAIPDMPMVATTIGALALFAMASEARGGRGRVEVGAGAGAAESARAPSNDGDDEERPVNRRASIVLGIIGAAVLVQAIYLGVYFRTPLLPIVFGLVYAALWREGWLILRLPFVLVGGALLRFARPPRTGSWWRHVFAVLETWEARALDRYLLAVLPALAIAGTLVASLLVPIPRANLLALLGLDVALAAIWGMVLYLDGWRALWALVARLVALSPITSMRQVYLLGCYFLLGVGLLAKGPPGFAVVVGVAGLHVAVFRRWGLLYDGGFEIKRGLLVLIGVAVPWHLAMWLREGARFANEYIFMHIIDRAASGVDNSPGTFAYYTDQLGHGMWLWAALVPAALVGVFARTAMTTREGRVRVLVGLWAITAVFVFCFVQTKFHHYILPAIPALGVVVAFYLDDLWTRRERMHWVYGLIGVGVVLLVCRDLMWEPDRWIEMFTYRYDRPWPSAEPWLIDPSDGFLVLGVAGVCGVIALCISRWGVIVIGAAALAVAVWAQQVYMPLAGTHWGMRDAFVSYYRQRTIYGQRRVFFDPQQCLDGLAQIGTRYSFETAIPDALQLGQPMTLTLSLEHDVTAADGQVVAIGDHEVTVELFSAARAQLSAMREMCKRRPQHQSRRRALAFVDADRLIAWQLYWRGEQFWSGGEIWGGVPELETSFPPTPNSNAELARYLNDRERAPIGRRYYVITDALRATSMRTLLTTARARESFRIVDTTSNKFTLAAFDL